MTSHIRNCYITAPAGSNLDLLIEALRKRNINIVVPRELRLGTADEAEFATLLSDVDLVIGVLTHERRSEWILFELGQAWGLGKRILLFAPPKAVHLPSTLRRFLTVRANLSNREAIEFALDQLLAAPEPGLRSAAAPKVVRSPAHSVGKYFQGSYPKIASVAPAELEVLVGRALREAGVDVLATSGDRERGADLAIWSDPLQAVVGNPLLVEIKSRLVDRKATSKAAQELSQHVSAAGGLWGLLLYGSGPAELTVLPPNILALPIGVLFQRLENESLDNIVRDLRNRRVHGADS